MTEHPIRSPVSNRHRPTAPAGWVFVALLAWNGAAPGAIAEPQPPSPTLTPSSIAIPDAYTLGAGDLLRVDILDVPEYSGEYLILSDGALNLPLVGSLEVGGLTVGGAADKISAAYVPFVRQPFATVTIVTPRPMGVAVAGEVKRPGTYVLPLAVSDTADRQFQFYKVTQLLREAGGVTQSADIAAVEVRRQNPTRQTIIVNLKNLVEDGDLSQDLILRDGDTIVVPTADTLDPIAIRQIESANFSPQTASPFPVAVVGEVFSPGTHLVGEQRGAADGADLPTITRAIEIAGGITPRADLRAIELRRLNQSGELQVLRVDLWQLLKTGDATQDVTLQPGDAIVIPEARHLDPGDVTAAADASFAPETMPVNVVGEVRQPGPVEVPTDTTLNQALLAAGGFDASRANMGSVVLLRLNPDGTVSQQQIRVDFRAGMDAPNNPMLRRDDVVVVSRSTLTQIGDGLQEVFRPFGGLTGISSLLNIIDILTDSNGSN